MTTSCTDTKHPYYGEVSELPLEDTLGFFIGDNSFRMRFVSLGEALDFTSAGGMNYVLWNMGKKELVSFVKNWMDEQKPRIEYKEIPSSEISGVSKLVERKREHSYLWNKFNCDEDVELPYIDEKRCSGEKHVETIRDGAGRLRCAHINKRMLRPSFIEVHVTQPGVSSDLGRRDYYEVKPLPSSIPENFEDGEEPVDIPLDEDPDYQAYLKEKEAYDSEEPTEVVVDSCYAIISDKGVNLSLESVLTRLCIDNSFMVNDNKTSVYPFTGFTLANYVKAWHNQKGRKRFFLPRRKFETHRAFPNFMPLSSD